MDNSWALSSWREKTSFRVRMLTCEGDDKHRTMGDAKGIGAMPGRRRRREACDDVEVTGHASYVVREQAMLVPQPGEERHENNGWVLVSGDVTTCGTVGCGDTEPGNDGVHVYAGAVISTADETSMGGGMG